MSLRDRDHSAGGAGAAEHPLSRVFRHNGLSLVMFGLFLASLVGQVLTGLADYNSELSEHGQSPMRLGSYLTSGHFIEAVFENWESEFLQMGILVVFTVFLRQKGSSESKSLEGDEEVDHDPARERGNPRAPGPVRSGRLVGLYSHSLSIALFTLFALSWVLHAVGGTLSYNAEQARHGLPPATVFEYLATSHFWFESFQNWQSEFLSVAALVVLSIFLRERGSPQSKPVAAAHAETGE